MSRLRALPSACLAIAAVALVPADAGGAACASASARPGQASRDALAGATLCVLNGVRRDHGLRRLSVSRRLQRAALRHSRDMVRRRYFAHDSLSGASFVDRIRRAGYLSGARRWMVAENLAWGAGTRASPAAIVDAWMRSRGHRRNILTARYREIGIGVVFGAPSGIGRSATYTTDFGATS
jgi:uncharacterized protein YkwD